MRNMTIMGKVTISIPLVTWREGRPRFVAGPRHRKMGYKGEDLRHPPHDRDGRPVGPWFSLEEAIVWSAARKREIAARLVEIDAGKSIAKVRAAVAGSRAAHLTSVGQMVESFLEQKRMKGEWQIEGRRRRQPLAANTVRYYKQARRVLEAHNEGRVWNEAAAAVSHIALDGILAKIEARHGLAQARGVRAMLSTAYRYGIKMKMVAHNPVADMQETLPTLEARVRYGSIDEMKALVAAADAVGRPEIGDAILLGLHTGQRQNDRLALEAGQITGEGIVFRQGKKNGAPLLIPLTQDLTQRLAAARARRIDWRVNWPHVVLDEVTRRPFEADWYRKVFRLVRDAAVDGVKDETGGWKVEPCTTLADFRDQDLRDTAVTWLALAGCSKFEVASITGHSLKSIDTILSHYLGLHPELARSAIGKLVTYLEAKG